MKDKRKKSKKPLIQGVVVTGASGGIGLAFADYYARFPYSEGGTLVMISRNVTNLNQAKRGLLKKYPKAKILTLAIDLSSSKAPEAVFKFCDRYRIQVRVLINNAGVGYIGAFHKSSVKNLSELLLLNTYGLTRLAHLFLSKMERREDKGVLLNVASTAAFQAMPYFAVYAATKAYVLSLSVALAEEYRHKGVQRGVQGVQVLAICPGPTQTNFMKRALQEAKPSILREFPRNQIIRESEDVVETTMKAVRSGKSGVHIDGRSNNWLVKLTSLFPYRLKARIAAKFFKEFSETESTS